MPINPALPPFTEWGGQPGTIGERSVGKSPAGGDGTSVDPDLAPILAGLGRMAEAGLFDEGRFQASGRSSAEPVIGPGSPVASMSSSMFGRIVEVLERVGTGTATGAPISPEQARRLANLMRGGPERLAEALSRLPGLPGGDVAVPDASSTTDLLVEPTTMRVLAEFARREAGAEAGPIADPDVSRVIAQIEVLAVRDPVEVVPGQEALRLTDELVRIGRDRRVVERPAPRVAQALQAITELTRGSNSLWDVAPDIRDAVFALARVGPDQRQATSERGSVQGLPTDAPASVGQFSARAVAVTGFGPFASVAAGSDHTCALGQDGQVSCWGQRVWRQDPYGQTLSTNTPVAVPMPAGVTFDRLVAGDSHRCGLTTADTAYCWGPNSQGQLGDGTTDQRTSPVAVTGSQTFTSLAARANTTCGINSTRNILCWGERSQIFYE